MSSITDRAAEAAARAEIWWLFSRLYLERPAADFLQEFADALRHEQQQGHDAEGALANLTEFLAQDPDRAAAALQPEYTRLLRGIQQGYGPPPPYESLYRGEDLMGQTATAVTGFYRDAGFEDIFPDAGPQDHIGVELRFLALLCFREFEAIAAGDETEVQRQQALQRSFVDEHLLGWVPGYAERLIAESRTPFYASVARMTTHLVQLARAQLDAQDDCGDHETPSTMAMA